MYYLTDVFFKAPLGHNLQLHTSLLNILSNISCDDIEMNVTVKVMLNINISILSSPSKCISQFLCSK